MIRHETSPRRASSGRGTAAVIVLACAAIAIVPDLRAEFVAALRANLPFGWSPSPLPMTVSSNDSTLEQAATTRRRDEWIARAKAACLDPDLAPTLRLGAAETFRRLAVSGAGASVDELFESSFDVLDEAALQLAGDPAADLLLADALRERLRQPFADAPSARLASERLAGLLRSSQRAGADGIVDLVEAERAIAEERVAEARDALLRAARSGSIDREVRRRTAAAHRWLTSSGVPDSEARRFLIIDEAGDVLSGAGASIASVARQLAAADVDAAAATGKLDPKVEPTLRGLALAGHLAVRGALTTTDARQGLLAADLYRAALTTAPAARGLPEVRRDDPGEAALIGRSSERRTTLSRDTRRIVAVRGFLAGWALTLLFVLLLSVAWRACVRRPAPARVTQRERTRVSGAVFLGVFIAPVLLFQSENPPLASRLGLLEDPCFARMLLPLVAIAPILLRAAISSNYRNSGEASRSVVKLSRSLACLWLILFVATASFVGELRRRDDFNLDRLLLDRIIPCATRWPDLADDVP